MTSFVIAFLAPLIGGLLARYRVSRQRTIRNGPWTTSLYLLGSQSALARARNAVDAILSLDSTEAVYFFATCDSTGQPLSPDHAYELQGRALPARWWSITAYGGDYCLLDNPDNRYSIHSENVRLDPGKRFTVHLSRDAHPDNWIPLATSERIYLLLRIFCPDRRSLYMLSNMELPVIRRSDRAAS